MNEDIKAEWVKRLREAEKGRDLNVSLSAMNDNGATFAEIADIIENGEIA